MNRLFSNGDLSPFLSFRRRMEKAIRAQFSEYVILQVHDNHYEKVKRETAQVRDATEAAMGEALGLGGNFSLRSQERRAIAELRTLLNRDAKERELQDALLETDLLKALTCKIIKEVAMKPTADYRGMRMDLVLAPNNDGPGEIVELKRGSHLLLAHSGKSAERLSREITKSVKQIKQYGRRLDSDADAVASIEKRCGLKIEKPELRLVAGRRLQDANGYHLLSLAESETSDSKLQLQIYTWDGFLAELERIVD